MALFALQPGVGAAFRDALFGLATISFNPSVSELQLSRKRLVICCRDSAGESLGILSMYLEEDCSTGGIFSWAEDRALIVSPLNLVSHLRAPMLELQADHTLIVSIRLQENGTYQMILSSTFVKQGQDPRRVTLTRTEHGIGHNGRVQIEETERSITLSNWYPLLFGCRYPNHTLSTVYIPLNPTKSSCVCYDISEVIVGPN